MIRPPAYLVLSDGAVFEGSAAGYAPEGHVTSGEFVFNTALSGYQEVITDPSYAGQIVTFTYPHVGNYGVTPFDDESSRPWCEGVVVRELSPVASNWRATQSLEAYLHDRGVSVICDVDTRRLTRHLRAHGALTGAFGRAPLEVVARHAELAVGTDRANLVDRVSCSAPYERGSGDRHIVVLDYGIKATMVAQLAERFRVTVMPSTSSAAEVLARDPDGIFLSNGPGDPVALSAHVGVISELLDTRPLFGICLGHQLLATALGASTYKLPFGHHGSNHPVKDLATGRVEITAQNHNYAVAADSLRGVRVSHVNLNDDVVEGLVAPEHRCFSVQYHPEAGPGPHDARYLFDRFDALVRHGRVED
jgi:carbamoyl-phosphate synthase small subunit